MPHFDAAYNFARWLTHNEHDAEDITHEAYLRAMTFFDGFRGGDAKAWILAIVRNACRTYYERGRARHSEPFDEDVHRAPHAETMTAAYSTHSDPESSHLEKTNAALVNQALRRVPPDAREVLILREVEELSYKQIAHIVDVPVGTVMSRLHRGRRLLSVALHRLVAASRLRPSANVNAAS